MTNSSKLKYILTELAHHLPYSIFGVTVAIVIMGMFNFLAILLRSEDLVPAASEALFHILHPAHILLSAVVTTAIFWKNEKKLFKAVLIGFTASIVICSLSDIFFPYLGGMLLASTPMEMHICVIEEPGLVIPFAFLGILGGILMPEAIEKSTQYSHSAHVFVSSSASLLYLIAFGIQDWMPLVGAIFMITITSVMIPCCASDIVIPLIFVRGQPSCDHRH